MNDMVAEANFVATVIILSSKTNYGIILIFEIFNFDNSVNFFFRKFCCNIIMYVEFMTESLLYE